MTDLRNTLAIAASGMRAQATRLRLVAENLANTDTPGYRRKTVSFEAEASPDAPNGAVKTGRVQLDQASLNTVYDPGHPLADETGRYDGSNVNSLIEIADSREAQRGYEANLKVFDQARQMSRSLLELLRN